MLAYVFPGQGSQVLGMGKEYFDEFSELTEIADNILGYSIKELCLEDPENKLGFTQYTQPALYVVNAMSYLKKVQETGVKPDFVAGHSLGEYDALFAADVFDFGTGLELVKKRGELMGQAKNGGMAAVLGLSEEAIREIMQNSGLDYIDIANLNSPSQTVISGIRKDIEDAAAVFEAGGALKYVTLNVSGAFHSRYMSDAQEQFAEFMDKFQFNEPNIPVISNVYARPYKKNAIKETLLKQITSSVKWSETIRYIWGKGDVDIVQIGPGNVLTGLTRGIKRDSEPLVINEEEEEIQIEETPENETENIIDGNSGLKEDDTYAPSKTNILGSDDFKKKYKLKYAYLAGPMYKGISSAGMIEKLAKAGMLGFYGTAGVDVSEVEKNIQYLSSQLNHKYPYGVNLMADILNPKNEEAIVDLLLKYDIRVIQASAYINMSSAIVRYKLTGLKRVNGEIVSTNKIIAKLSRPEIASAFLKPAPTDIVEELLRNNKITKEQADLSQSVPIADDICVEADSAGHTDNGIAYTLFPSILRIKDSMVEQYGYTEKINIGCAGGIGTPEAIAAALIMGADFVMTGSINQCSVEAATSDTVKDMLQNADIQDTEYIPSGDNFEFASKAQVLRKGVLFHVRAAKLYEVYKMYNSLDAIDAETKKQIETRYFLKSFDDIYAEIKSGLTDAELDRIERNPKYKMSLIFKWYYENGTNMALKGNKDEMVDFMINCSSAMGAFNHYVKGTNLENWRNRHVDAIGKKLMNDAADLLKEKINGLINDWNLE